MRHMRRATTAPRGSPEPPLPPGRCRPRVDSTPPSLLSLLSHTPIPQPVVINRRLIAAAASSPRPPRPRAVAAPTAAPAAARAALPPPTPGFDAIEEAIAAVAAGAFVVVLDDAARENEGDLILAAAAATPAALHFMVEHTSGVICVGLPGGRCDALALPPMVAPSENEDAMRTAFTVTVDAAAGVTTGISAADRATTIRLLADLSTSPHDLRRPGHIFPLRARAGGVRERPGHTEAAVDLARLAGCGPAGVLCEIVDRADGSMARTPLLRAFAAEHGLKCVTIEDLAAYMDAVGA